MPKVMKCMCEECYYNDNFECCADEIQVRSSAESNKVTTSEGTCCDTFIHRNSE